MDRTLHQLTVLAASGVVMIIALSTGFSSTQNSNWVESHPQKIEVAQGGELVP